MLAEVIRTLEVPLPFWAELAGCSPSQMNEWLSGQRSLPESVAERLSSAIGVPASTLLSHRRLSGSAQDLLPPLWGRARDKGLAEPEHRAIAVARLLATRYQEILSLLDDTPGRSYRSMFEEIRSDVDPQLPAEVQGEAAAGAFLRLTTLHKGGTGIGEVFRGYLRAWGILILETPVDSEKLEGFCLPVGGPSAMRPCLLANAYRTTWFGRNHILLHELAHAIFDLEGTTAVFDEHADLDPVKLADVAERRADSFAMHALASRKVLETFQAKHGAIAALDAPGLAELVAYVHAELRLTLRAASKCGLVSEEEAARLSDVDIAAHLRQRSSHARRLAELDKSEIHAPDLISVRNRTTTFPLAGVRLPVPFVKAALDALRVGKIVPRKAAELLMITPDDIESRFPSWIPPAEAR